MPSFAQISSETNFKALLMPGALSIHHAEFESNCGNCHLSFEKIAQPKLCLDCHKEIASDIQQKNGFHGNINSSDSCLNCHFEHLGREAKITLFDPEIFDHSKTDFILENSHIGLNCNTCHQPDIAFRDTPNECVGCHKDSDVHKNQMGNSCDSCHSTKAWSEVKFDHNTTDFHLRGKHVETTCASCHPDRIYQISQTCVSCHRLDDAHFGTRGTVCENCHTSDSWKTSRFDHDKDTHFALTGSHQSLSCESCHKNGDFQSKQDTRCISCHSSDDVHLSLNGTDCASCHQSVQWSSTTFDHSKATDFPLTGAHSNLICSNCHIGNVHEQKLSSECIACHKTDDIHSGSLGTKCDSCHNEQSWIKDVRFDHDFTRYPLIGMHNVVACESCHTTTQFRETPHACSACHSEDDGHRGTLGSACEVCHSPTLWKSAMFDHNTQTSFTLTGKHEALQCDSCHTSADRLPSNTSTQCVSCHKADDIHSGGFGSDCNKCHNTSSFGDLQKILRQGVK